MKIKKFKDIINEGLLNVLKGKSLSDILVGINNLNDEDAKFKALNKLYNQFPEIINDVIDNISKIDFDINKPSENKVKFLSNFMKHNPEKFKNIIYNKLSDEQKIREDYFNIYAFLEYDDYKKKIINGEEYFKKQLNFEQLYHIDIFDESDLNSISGMKIRSKFQQGTTLYLVFVPKELLGKKKYNDISELSDYEKEYIQQNKFRI